MDNLVTSAIIVGGAVIFGAYIVAVAVEEARKSIVIALRANPTELPQDEFSAIPRAIDRLRHDVAAIRRKIRDEPDPPTFEEVMAGWATNSQPEGTPVPTDETPRQTGGETTS